MSYREEFEDKPLWERISENPGPATRWGAVLFVLLALEFGALMNFIMSLPWDVAVGGLASNLPAGLGGGLETVTSYPAWAGDQLSRIPTLLTRDLIPNRGYNEPGVGWQNTFLNLPPAYAWAIRVVLIYAYGFFFLYWLIRGYFVFRKHYRYADWTPMDDTINRLRTHRWGQFGFIMVAMFVIMAVFAPALGTTTVGANLQDPYGHHMKYYDEDTEQVRNITVGTANLGSQSKGDSQVYGIGSYDPYQRFHPAGTLTNGKDLFTFMAHGARVSLFIGMLAITIGGGIALALASVTAYYKGMVDLAAIILSDAFMALPRLLVLVMLSVVLSDHWISELFDGGLLLALLFGAWGWPFLWRAIRGPALQAVENEWVDAAESYGQKPTTLVRRHIAPFTIAYLIIYGSMSIGGYMIGTAGLTYLGIGITAPTPEWGRAVAMGQNYVTTKSWHMSILPGIAVLLVVVGFNAMGDGVRDAIDPQSEGGGSEEIGATGGA